MLRGVTRCLTRPCGSSWVTRLTGVKGSDLAAAGISVYGPRTTITLAIKGVEGAHEFLLVDDFTARHGQWVKTNTFTAIG